MSRNWNLCFLLLDGNSAVSDVHRDRCQEFTKRNRQRKYASLDGDSPSRAQAATQWPFTPLGRTEPMDPVKKIQSRHSNASTPLKSPAPTPTPQTPDLLSSVATQNSSTDIVGTPNASQEASPNFAISPQTFNDNTPQLPPQINLTSMVSSPDKSTPPALVTPITSKQNTRRACVSLLLSAPLIWTKKLVPGLPSGERNSAVVATTLNYT